MTANHPIYRQKPMPIPHIEAPLQIIWYLSGSFVSLGTLGYGLALKILGQLPDPNTASAWSFYGVLIVAIIVLFLSLAASIRWFFGYWMKKQDEMLACMRDALQENSKSNLAVADAVRKNTEVTSKQNDWFDNFAKESLKGHLSIPRGGGR